VGGAKPDYTNPHKVFEELEAIEKSLRRHRIPIVDVTGKPIETSADEIIRIVRKRKRMDSKITL
jgi:regulator of PEP synthase PpsR (kinase-PPPase family)